MNPIIETQWIALSTRVYHALLILYPADYRREYGALMVQVFRDVCRDTYGRQGLAGIALWWCRTLLDLTLTVVEQRRKVRLEMSKSLFIQFTGPLLALGGLFSAVAAFSALQPGDHYTYYGIYQLLIWLWAPGFLLTGLGCIGLALRYEPVFGSLNKGLLLLTAAGLLMMSVGVVATSINADLWEVWLVGALVHVAGLTGFGLLHLRTPTLPIFRALPLQLASGWLFMLVGIPARFPQSTNNLLTFVLLLGVGLAWLAIGLRIQRPQPAPAAA